MWTPIFCANCGGDGGLVPEENNSFAFYLCPACYESHGHLAGMMVEPDQVFWERIQQEQLEKYRRTLSKEELQQITDEGGTPLAKLIKEGVK